MVNSLLSTVAKACPCASKNCRRMNDQPGPYGRFIRSGQNDDHGPAQKQNTKKFPGKHDESSNAQKCHREASQLVEPVARKLMLPGNVNKKCHQASDKSISFCHAEITTKESNFEQNKKISKKQFDSISLTGISWRCSAKAKPDYRTVSFSPRSVVYQFRRRVPRKGSILQVTVMPLRARRLSPLDRKPERQLDIKLVPGAQNED